MRLSQQLLNANIDTQALDHLVHEAASRVAARTNNEGMKEQLDFLNANGYTDKDILNHFKITPES